MQDLHVDRRSGVGPGALADNPRRALKELAAPLRDLVRMHVELLRRLGQRLCSMAAIATFALKAALRFGAVVSSWSLLVS